MSARSPILLHLEFFGGFAAKTFSRNAPPITRFRSRQAALLLAFLGFHAGRNFPREELIEMLWPDCEPHAARNRFSVALSSLRTQLQTLHQPLIFSATRDAVGINAAAFSSDVAEFQSARRAAEGALKNRGDSDAIKHLSRAVELYRGRFLPGFYDDWSAPLQTRLEEDFFAALQTLIALHERAGNWAQAIALAERGLALDAAREEIAQSLIALYSASGQGGAARKCGREIERALRENLQSSPSASTRALMEKPNRAASTPAAFVALGMANLPKPRTKFFGRVAESQFLQNWLCEDGARLLTLSGAGGSGKTRFAIEAINNFADEIEVRFPGGAFFVALSEIHDAQLLPETLRAALHLAPAPNADALTQVVQSLAARPALLLLDNFEQLVPNGISAIETLLDGAPQLKILVSSRQRLNLSGEREYSLAPLATGGNADDKNGDAALDLFCDRAQLAHSDFRLDAQSTLAARRLVARLDGIPLAIELAASRADVLTPQQILGCLDEPSREEILVSKNRDVAPRHRTLQSAIVWSFDLLPGELQNFWLALSVFRGGSTPDAAGNVCGEKSALNALSILRDNSLLEARQHDGAMRFYFLETLRQWAHERLPLAQKTVAQNAHAAHFTQWAESQISDSSGANQAQIFSALETENDNLRAALDWCETQDAVLGLRLAVALREFWRLRGYYDEGRRHFAALLQALPNENHETQLRANALRAQGQLDYHAGEYAEARPHLQSSLELFESLGDDRGAARARGLLGWILVQTGDAENGRAQMQNALAAYQRLEEWDGLAELLFSLSVARGWRDENVFALTKKYLRKFRARQDGQSIVIALNALGTTAFFSGRTQEARLYIEESLELSRQLGQVWDITLSLWILGNIARGENQFSSAREFYEQSLRVMRAAGKWPIPLLLQAFSYLDFAEENFSRAALLLSASIALWPPAMHAAPLIQEERERHHALLKEVLTPADFQHFWHQGEQLDFEDAVALALNEESARQKFFT